MTTNLLGTPNTARFGAIFFLVSFPLLGVSALNSSAQQNTPTATKPATAVTIGDPRNPATLPTELQEAYEGGARVISIRSGSYILPYGDKDVFRLKEWKDATIRARGVTLISSEYEWNRNFFVFDHCTGVKLEGPTLTQNTLSFFQGRVVATGKDEAGKAYVDWQPDAGYPVPGDADAKVACFFADPATRQLKPGLGDFWGKAQKPLGKGLFRVEMDDRASQIQVGDVFLGRYGNMPFKIHLVASRDCTIQDVTLSRNGFAPIREENVGGGGNHILGVKWTPGARPVGATQDPLVNSAADGLHSTGANPGPDIENCDFQGIILDDPIAIHGYFQEVLASEGKYITLKEGGAGLKAGEPIRLYDDKGFLLDSTVEATRDNGDKTSTISIASEAVVPKGARVVNPLTCGAGYKIINNHIQGTRSRGILVKGDNGTITGNLIENCGMSAVSVGPEYYWNEADYVRGTRIENNTLRGNGSVASATVFVHGEGTLGNRDIEVRNNSFEGNYRDDIDAQWTQNLVVRGNSFAPRQTRLPSFGLTSPIVVANTRQIDIRGNRITAPAQYAPQLVRLGAGVVDVKSDMALPKIGMVANAEVKPKAPQPLPLENGTFDLPSIAPEKAKNYLVPQGWGAKNDGNDAKHGGPGLMVGYGGDGKGQYFFWNAPLGALSQTIPAPKYVIGGAGDVFTLSYRYRFGPGTVNLKTSLLVGGGSVVSKTQKLNQPSDWQEGTLTYTASAADAGKTVGVEFDWRQEGDVFTQPALADVKLSVLTDRPLLGAMLHDGSLTDTNLRYIGHWDKSDAASFHSYWGGAYLRAKFNGTSVQAKVGSAAGGQNLLVSLDGETPREVTELSAKNLKSGPHNLVVGAPNQNSEIVFRGLTLDAGATTLPVETRPIIEFVGDSITTGGGQTRPNTVNYAWQTAELLGADHTQIAFSGRALTTGFGCAGDKAALDTQYFQLKNFNHLGDTPQTAWDFSYTPKIVVINLGQNDQCGQEPAGTFAAAYVAFVQKIRAKFPTAQIAAMRPFGGPYEAGVRQAVETLNNAGDKKVIYVDTTGWLEKTDYVDGIHPNEAGHDKVAQKLAPILKPLLSAP